MVRRRRAFQNLKSIAWAGIGGMGIVALVRLDGPTGWLNNLFGTTACDVLRLVPYLAPAAWHALQALAFGGQPASPCPVQVLVSLWPLVQVVAGAA